MRNPHSPTDSWVKAVVDNAGYDSDPDVGDSGKSEVVHESGTYEIMITKVED